MFFHSFINRKRNFLLLFFISVSSFSQQIGDGVATYINDFSLPLKSGLYQGSNPIGATPDLSHPWQHLFVLRHSEATNNHQLQIGASYNTNDRLFFRKIAAGLQSSNPEWIEVATRGVNTFVGNQSFSGDIAIGKDAQISTISGPANSGAIQIKTNSSFGGAQHRYLRLGWKDNNSVFYPAVSVNEDLNVGIGTTTPAHKLDVIGTIRSREVKVDMNGADFVFEEKYPLMPLSELETYIKKNKHLPEIAPAKEMQEQGSNLGDLNTKLLQKIEELTLYVIEIKKENETLKQKYDVLEKHMNKQKKEQND